MRRRSNTHVPASSVRGATSIRWARPSIHAVPVRRRRPRTSGWRRTACRRRVAPGPTVIRGCYSTRSTGACGSITSSGRKACSRCRRRCSARRSRSAVAARRSCTARSGSAANEIRPATGEPHRRPARQPGPRRLLGDPGMPAASGGRWPRRPSAWRSGGRDRRWAPRRGLRARGAAAARAADAVPQPDDRRGSCRHRARRREAPAGRYAAHGDRRLRRPGRRSLLDARRRQPPVPDSRGSHPAPHARAHGGAGPHGHRSRFHARLRRGYRARDRRAEGRASQELVFLRPSGRRPNELRPVRIHRRYTKHAEGSVLVQFGDTQVLCTASVDERLPPFLKESGRGWVTAEYGMLPRSTNTRTDREAARGKQSGRTQEIQRLIGRSLRAVVDLAALGPRSVQLDCDVLQADGGTRTAAITGSFVALHDAITWLQGRRLLAADPIRDFVAAVSVGIHQGAPVLDLDYAEDATCGCDMNIVMTGEGNFVEVQGTAEGAAFGRAQLDELISLGERGIRELIAAQRRALGLG